VQLVDGGGTGDGAGGGGAGAGASLGGSQLPPEQVQPGPGCTVGHAGAGPGAGPGAGAGEPSGGLVPSGPPLREVVAMPTLFATWKPSLKTAFQLAVFVLDATRG
jgi:hypothetical protein